ncbi:MAG: hypothetical protein QQN54_04990, partial [Nitrosopumilus sp.]
MQKKFAITFLAITIIAITLIAVMVTVSTEPTITTNSQTTVNTCSSDSIQMESNCLKFNINGAVVKSSTFDESSGST